MKLERVIRMVLGIGSFGDGYNSVWGVLQRCWRLEQNIPRCSG